MTAITICGTSRGRYGWPWRVDGPRGVKVWRNEDYKPVKPPKTLYCDGPKHEGRKHHTAREDCYIQRWQLTRAELDRAIAEWDMLEMPPRFLCRACAKKERVAK